MSIADSKSFGTNVLEEVLGEIALKLEGDGVVEDHAALPIAANHGLGFLTGSAAAILDYVPTVLESGDINQYEEDLLTAASYLVLAVVAGRLSSSGEIDDDGGPDAFPPIIDATIPVGEIEQPRVVLAELLQRLRPGSFFIAG